MLKLIMVGMGGATGAICRYLVGEYSNRFIPVHFLLYPTLIVNVVGCLFIGFLGGLSESKDILTPEIRGLLVVGFLGGLTTFSTFGYEIFILAKGEQLPLAILNTLLHLVFGFGAVWVGFTLSKLFY